jgi:hypothetical protein
MTPTEMWTMFPIGQEIIDCFGYETVIRGNRIEVSKFEKGVFLLGKAHIFDAKTGRWAVPIKKEENENS